MCMCLSIWNSNITKQSQDPIHWSLGPLAYVFLVLHFAFWGTSHYVIVWALFSACRWLLSTVSSCGLFAPYNGTRLLMGAPPTRPHPNSITTQGPHFPNTTAVGTGAPTCAFWENTDIQSIVRPFGDQKEEGLFVLEQTKVVINRLQRRDWSWSGWRLTSGAKVANLRRC